MKPSVEVKRSPSGYHSQTPSQRGSGVAAMALLDDSAVTWLRAQLEGADDGPAE